MTIIVSGRIFIKPGRRDTFIERSLHAVIAARQASGCLDFAVSPDPIEKNRVNIFEKWRSRGELLAFRGSGPEDGIASLIEVLQIDEDEVE